MLKFNARITDTEPSAKELGLIKDLTGEQAAALKNALNPLYDAHNLSCSVELDEASRSEFRQDLNAWLKEPVPTDSSMWAWIEPLEDAVNSGCAEFEIASYYTKTGSPVIFSF